jgi:hypothetical protein
MRRQSGRDVVIGREASTNADAWVCDGIKDVSEQTAQCHCHSAYRHGRGDQRVVASGDRLGREATHAGPRKDRLDKYCAAHKRRKR